MSRELLELAAKAAGKGPIIGIDGNAVVLGPRSMSRQWSPLDDDGDSRRLAVALRLDIGFDDDCEEVYVRQANDPFTDAVSVPYGDNVEAAARLAVLRMAAEIGRAMTAHNGVDSPANIS